MVVYPTLPGKPVQSQDTLGCKLLKVCAGSNPTWIGAPSCFHSLVRSSALTKLARFCSARQTPSSDPHNRMEPSEPCCTSGIPTSAFWTPPCRRWFYTESQSGSCSNAVGMTLILPASDSTRFVRLSQVAQVRKKRGALHKTIITKHLQGKVRVICESEKDGSHQGVSDHTLSRHNFPPIP